MLLEADSKSLSAAHFRMAAYSQRGCQATSRALAPSRIHGVGSAPVKVSLAVHY